MSKLGEGIEQVSTIIDTAFNRMGDAVNHISEKGIRGIGAVVLAVSVSAGLGSFATDAVKARPAAAEASADQGDRIDGSLNGANERVDRTNTQTSTESSDSNNESQNKAKVDEAVKANTSKFREAGGGRAASERVARQEVSVFLGADRGEIVGERADGACIIATQDGKRFEEFTKTELKVGMTPEEAKEVYVNGLCNGEDGVNVPAVATYMAHLEAMKNNIDIQKDFEKVNTELTVKYIDAMKDNPDLAQVYLETVKDLLGKATFGDVTSIEGQRDTSIYTDEDGHIVTVSVLNKEGAVEVPITFTTENVDGVMVIQTAFGKRCLQLLKKYAPETPKKATPTRKVRRPRTPVTPTTPVTPETPVYDGSATVCVGLNPDGTENNQTFTVTDYPSQAAADAAAQELANAAKGDCTPPPPPPPPPPEEPPKFSECDMDKDGDVDADDRANPNQPEHCNPNEENENPIPTPTGDPTNPGEDEPPQVQASIPFLLFGLSIRGISKSVVGTVKGRKNR